MADTLHISREDEALMTSLHTFYGFPTSEQPSNNILRILPILNGNSQIAIRVIDWFVTNYAKKHHVSYMMPNSNEKFDVYCSYRSLLDGYNKELFDPFCRKGSKRRIPFKYANNENDFLLTTLGQLNFFRWLIKYNVLTYVEENYDKIKKDMEDTNSNRLSEDSKTTTASTTERKRRELSENSYKSLGVDRSRNIVITI
jgi:hypothetical protein